VRDPADAEVELVAMPALHLDAALVHTNRADTAGNGQILGPDSFFDPLFLGAADRRFLTTERIVGNGALSDEGALSTVVIHRLLTDGVAETPGGAHFTANPPDYGRDESFQKEYAAAAGDVDQWNAFARRYVDVSDEEYRAHVDERRAS
jgi:glutaconate CoA-transferase, subunit A